MLVIRNMCANRGVRGRDERVDGTGSDINDVAGRETDQQEGFGMP